MGTQKIEVYICTTCKKVYFTEPKKRCDCGSQFFNIYKHTGKDIDVDWKPNEY